MIVLINMEPLMTHSFQRNSKIKTKIILTDLFSKRRDEKKKKYKFTFIDLFAGIGGIRIGFEYAGGECVFTSEWDESAQKTYKANFGEIPYGDITKINAEEIPSFDVLLAGFPCQPFSQAGLKKGFEDTRGTLFFDIARIIKHHKPSVVFLENVRNLIGHDKGNTLKVIINTLEEMDYKIKYNILNAKDFGLPQNRARIYIIGFKDDVNFEFPEPPKTKTRVWDILDKKVDSKYTISDKLWAGHQRRKKEHEEKGNGFGYSLFDEKSDYTSTISARYYKDGSEILIKQKDNNPRKLTPREAARLQGYPENFVIPVSDIQAYKQFGNSVAVPVIKALANQIIKTLEKFPKNSLKQYENK
jgi:DNA (cytosine-5)-methyltransferase 1